MSTSFVADATTTTSLAVLIDQLNDAGWSVCFDAARTVRVRHGHGANAVEFHRRVPVGGSLTDALSYLKQRTESED